MEVNKYEAERCIELAENYIREHNRKEAERFLHKAERLYPTERAKELLLSIQFMTLTTATNEPKQPRNAKTEDAPSRPTYTAEQAEAEKRLQRCTDYYEILLVSKDATDDEIKKSYKKLALLLHPDKNSHSGAAEAFKKIRNAVAELTNAENRKQYDHKKTDEGRPSCNHSFSSFAYSDDFEDLFTNDENREQYDHKKADEDRPSSSNSFDSFAYSDDFVDLFTNDENREQYDHKKADEDRPSSSNSFDSFEEFLSTI